MHKGTYVLLAVLAALPLPAAALQVSPTYQVFEVKPGDAVKGQMTLTNNDDETVSIAPSVKEWFQLKANAGHKVESWLRLDEKDEFNLKPGESRLITYKLIAPKKAKGELAGAVTFATKPKAQMVTLQLSVVQYLALKGTEKVDVEVEAFGVTITSNTEVGVILSNTGNVHIRPRGFIYVDRTSGERVVNAEITVGHPTFPGDSRLYSSVVKGFKLGPGNYTARVELRDADRPIDYPVETKKFTVREDGKVEVR